MLWMTAWERLGRANKEERICKVAETEARESKPKEPGRDGSGRDFIYCLSICSFAPDTSNIRESAKKKSETTSQNESMEPQDVS